MSDATDPEAAGRDRRLAAYRQIRLWGDPALRAVATPVRVFGDALDRDVQRLVDVMLAAPGSGLAAPQVGQLSRLVVYRLPEDEGPPRVLVNPTVADASSQRTAFVEGCLSMPGLTAEVERAERVVVHAQDQRGIAIEVVAEGHHAAVVQHELDHLDGILLPDRLSPPRRRAYLRDVAEAARSGWPGIDPRNG